MLRRFADLIYQQLLISFPSGQAYPRAAFDGEPMPAPVSQYLVQALETRLEVEVARVKQMSSPWLDAEHPEVRSALDALANALIRHGQIPAEEWNATLERAVRNVVSYHARPARTLLDFLFVRESDVYTPTGLTRKLAFFRPYPLLSDKLQEHVERDRLEEINRDTMTALVGEIDEAMRASFDVDAWTRLVEPLFEIAAVLPDYREEVSVELLVTFFRDKGMNRMEQRLERLHEEQGVDLIGLEDVRRVIKDVRTPSGRPAHAVRHERIIQPEATSVQSSHTASLRPPERTSPVPLWQQFQQSPHAQPAQPMRPEPRPAPSHPPEPAGEARPLWMRFSEASPDAVPSGNASPEIAPLSELERAVLGEQAARGRDAFVRTLFRGSQPAYREALERLSRAGTWTEASRIIAHQVFRTHQVDIYSDAAVSFTNAVEARYEAS